MTSNPRPIAEDHDLGDGNSFSFAIGTTYKGRQTFQDQAYLIFYNHGCILGDPRPDFPRYSRDVSTRELPIEGTLRFRCLNHGSVLKGDNIKGTRKCPCRILLKFSVDKLKTDCNDIVYEMVEFDNRHEHHPRGLELPAYKQPVIIQKYVEITTNDEYQLIDDSNTNEEDELDGYDSEHKTSERSKSASSRSPVDQNPQVDPQVDDQTDQELEDIVSEYERLSTSPGKRNDTSRHHSFPVNVGKNYRQNLASTRGAISASGGGSRRRGLSVRQTRASVNAVASSSKRKYSSSSTQSAKSAKQPKLNPLDHAEGQPRSPAVTTGSWPARDQDRPFAIPGPARSDAQARVSSNSDSDSTSLGNFLRQLVKIDDVDLKFLLIRADSQKKTCTLDALAPYFQGDFADQERIEILHPNLVKSHLIPAVKEAFEAANVGVIKESDWGYIITFMQDGLKRFEKEKSRKEIREGKKKAH